MLLPAMNERSGCSVSSPIFVAANFFKNCFNFSHSLDHMVVTSSDFIWVPWWLTMLAIFKSVYWLYIVCVCVCVCVKCLSKTFSHLGIWWIIFLLFFVSLLYNQDMSHFSEYMNIFFQPHTCFSLSSMCLWLKRVFILTKSSL